MSAVREYTERVTGDGEGNYYWKAMTDRKYETGNLEGGYIACLLVGVFIFVSGLIMAINLGDLRAFLPVLISVALYYVIVIVIFKVCMNMTDARYQEYFMTDDHIEAGIGKRAASFSYKGTKKAVVNNRYIELNGNMLRSRIYVDAEDMSFVRNYIMSRIPGDAEIVYE